MRLSFYSLNVNLFFFLVIIFKNVSKIYHPNISALKEATLHIEPGEFVSIVGQSGVGKTTIVKLITAEERPTHGTITIGGWDITHIKNRAKPILRRQIGVIFQDFKLLPSKTVDENIAFALQVSGSPFTKIKTIVPQLIKVVGLEKKEDRFPKQLSGGEKQRVAIARALAHRPKVLVADEPTGNLDAINTNEIVDLLLKINSFGTTVVLVTHNREVVNNLHKRVITLEAGEIVSDQKKGKYML
ncbi:MAG: ABC superfamily ATP binding cassette transporter, ABC protein [Parcubacteria group bacterium GW2011_GWA2_43_13]|nr:MAG: ABC superfamily ATP binding cassette transporter, ABC protein [Parcubacteria group bacterium GW2011_GWA2_43_13]